MGFVTILLTLLRSWFCLCNLPTHFCFIHYGFKRQLLKQHTSFFGAFLPVKQHLTGEEAKGTSHLRVENKRSWILQYSVSQNWRYWSLKAFWTAWTWKTKPSLTFKLVRSRDSTQSSSWFYYVLYFSVILLVTFSLTMKMSASLRTLPCVSCLHIVLTELSFLDIFFQ